MYEQYIEILKERLNEYRFVHSMNVAKTARELAIRWGADPEKAYLAGLLHDICKNDSAENLLQMFDEFGIILDNVEKCAPKLWHAIAGAEYVLRVLKIDDKEIYSAIRCHTTAKAGMSLLDEILYLADYVSAERDYDGVERMRAFVDEDKDKALREALQFTILDLSKEYKPIHPDTFEAYNEKMCQAQLINKGQ